jgi:uncharacterized spore protein YtfJ
MSDVFRDLENLHGRNQEDASELVGRLFEVARPGVIFGEPVTAEGRTVITASEIAIGMGIGFGLGGASGTETDEIEDEKEGGAPSAESQGVGVGGGGGGGGASRGRPVAVVVVEPAGVRVEPIVDVTKLGLAMVTALGGIFAMAARMRRLGKS